MELTVAQECGSLLVLQTSVRELIANPKTVRVSAGEKAMSDQVNIADGKKPDNIGWLADRLGLPIDNMPRTDEGKIDFRQACEDNNIKDADIILAILIELSQFAQVRSQLDTILSEVKGVQDHQDTLEGRFDTLEKKVDDGFDKMTDNFINVFARLRSAENKQHVTKNNMKRDHLQV